MLAGWLGSVLLFAGLLASTLAVDRYCPKGVLDGTDDEAFDVRCGLRRGNRCILKNWECDETIDCADSSDEFPCGYMNSVQYVYKYSGDLTFPIHNDVNMHIKATIKLTKIDKDFIMKFEEPVLSQSNDDPTNLLSSEEKRAWKKEIKFKLSDNGEIGNIYYEADHPEDILNMKKGILSLFQLETQTNDNSMTHTYEKVETDVTGKCRVRYRSEREVVPTPGNVKRLYKINVTKINDYIDCEDRPLSGYQQMDPVKCDEEPGSNVPKSRMMTQCTIYIREDKLDSQPVINSCHSNETQEFQIQKKAGDSPLVIVAVRKHLQLQKIMIESQYHRQNWNSKSSILFSFDGLYPSDDKDSQEILDEVKSTLDGLHRLVNEETKAWDLLSAEAPGLYSKLIRQLRWKVDEATFKDIYQQYYNQDKYRIWLESALPFVGSDASGEEIKDKIESGSISGMSAMKLLSRLGVVNNPSKGLCKNIMDLCKSSVVGKNATVHSTCWLAFGSLVHSYCNEKRTCPDMFIEALKAEYDANLHNQEHHVKIIKDNEKLVVALKAIGNSGQKRLLPEVLKIITTWDDHNAIMIAAIEATRRMKLDDTNQLKVQQALCDIFLKRSFCPEIRMVAFQELIKTGPNRPAILMPLANTMRAEVNPLMKQFTYTYLDSESKIKCPAKKSRKASIDLLARTAGLPRPSFDIRYSFSKSFSLGGIQGIYNQDLNLEFAHTPISAIPRYIKMKNYMTLFGLYLESIEHKVRQREIVPLLKKLFGPHGIMEEKKSLWDFIRAKRSADGDGFPEVYKRMKETLDPTTRSEIPFKTTLSSKMFSSEIVYLVLNESHTFIQNLMKDGTIRVDKDWWSNTLKAGFKFNISANDILFDAAIKIPTSLGVPLKMKTNTAGIFALGLYVDVKTTPMLNLLSFSNKPTDISANGRECFSLSTYTQTKAFVFYRDLKLGYVVHQNMSHRCPVPIDKFTLSGQPPTQKYTVGIQMSKKKYVFSESSTTFYRFVKQRDGYIKLNKIDWKAPQMSVMPGIGIRPGGGQNSGGQVPGMGGGFQFPGIGQPQSGAGQPSPGWGPAAGAGQASGGQQAGWAPPVGAGQGFGQQSGSSTTPGAGQSSGGQLPSQGSGADVVVNSTMSVDVHVASSSAEFGQERCFEAWNKSMKLCMKTDNETSVSQMWYDPNTRIIEEIQIKYQNTTKEGDKESKFLLEFHVNGEKDTKIAEYHMELNVTAPRKRQPSLWDPTSSGIAANSGGFSAKAYEKKNGAISYMACMKSSLNVTAMQWDLGVQWGKTCKQYSINMSTALYYEQGNPSLNLSVSWDSLPAMVERLTCPKKYFEEMQKKILEELKKQMGSNAGMGAQGGKPGGMDGLPSGMSGGAGGMGGWPSGMSGGAGGMDGLPSGMSGGAGGMDGLPSGMSGGAGGMGGWPSGMSGGAGGMDGLPSGMSGGAGGMGGLPSGMSGGAGGMDGLPSGMSGGAGGMDGLPSGMSGGAGGKIGRAGGKSGGAGSISGGAGSISGGAGSISGGAGSISGGAGSISDGAGSISGGAGGISGGAGGITAGGIGGHIPGMGGAITAGGLPGGIPSLGQIPCIKRLDFKISLTNSTTLEVSGTLLPKPLTYSLPFNGTKVFEETKDILTYGITETCKVYNTDEITTFDKNTFTYDQSKGCPHVLAKDCSDKDLFTVFMKKDDKNKRIYTLVIKDKKNRGHVFEINHDLTVYHDGGLLQLKGNAKHKEADIPKLCKVTLKKSKHLIIKCRVGVILEASSSGLKIKVTPWYFGYMCGMCGNFNWEPNDDFERAPRDYRKANNDTFGASWLVPGKTCTSECKLVHHPDIQKPTGKLCISTSPVTRCAPNCQPTRQASSKLSYHCLDNGTDEATKVEKQITDKKFDEILKAFNGKEKDMKAQADVHVDCQCTCPAS